MRLADRAFDDLFALPGESTFVLRRRALDLAVHFQEGYAYAQVYAPPGKPFVAIEPMTAPIDGLVSGNCPVVAPGERYSAAFAVSAGARK